VENISAIASVLVGGGLAVIPTESFYGIAACTADDRALSRLVGLKERQPGSPLPLLASSLADVASRFELRGSMRAMAENLWPGPLTLALRPMSGSGIGDVLVAQDGTAGVRVSGWSFLRELCACVGCPLTATSANLRGGEPVVKTGDLNPIIESMIDLVVDGGVTAGGRPSTVVGNNCDGELVVIRKGAIDVATLAPFGVDS